MITIEECINLLRDNDKYLIVTHTRPDGDTVCSSAGLCIALQKMKKTAYLFNNTEITEKYSVYVRELIAPDGYEPSFRIIVDTASESLYPRGYEGSAQLCIDHHVSNTLFANSTLLMPQCSSCGEVVLHIVDGLGVLDAEIAGLLYIAVSTDTGCFCYGNTNAETHRAAARLIDSGAEAAHLNKQFFRTVSKERIMLESIIYSGMEFKAGGQIAIAKISLKILEETQVSEDDCEDIASLPGRISGVRIGVTIRETTPGMSKVSVRTSKNANASRICGNFGGGGHPLAAGCTINLAPDEAANEIIKACEEELK